MAAARRVIDGLNLDGATNTGDRAAAADRAVAYMGERQA